MSGRFRFNREVWDARGAQAPYDTRGDLGNTPEVDGDGFRNRGRGPIRVTGRMNIKEFGLNNDEAYDPVVES